MSTIKISELTEKITPDGTEEILVNDGGTSKKVTLSNLPLDSAPTENTTSNSVSSHGIFTALASKLSTSGGEITGALNNLTLKGEVDTGAYGDNAAVGIDNLVNTTGFGNTAMGYKAGEDITTGYFNTAIGANAGVNVSTGYMCVAVGNKAMSSTSTSGHQQHYSVAIGNQCAEFAETIIGCVGLGNQALQNVESASQNTAIGTWSLQDLTTADNTTAVGGRSGQNITTGDNNTCLGYHAGGNVDDGDGNTLIGANAGDNITIGDDNIIIGNGIDAPIATSSNQLMIGDFIYGQYGNVHIGGTTPQNQHKLYVTGNFHVTGDVTVDGDLPIVTSQVSYLRTDNPTNSTNPLRTGVIWLNKDTEEAFICDDSTENANGWTNISGGVSILPPTGSADLTTSFYAIGDRFINSQTYMGNTSDYNGPYDVGQVIQNGFTGTGRVYLGVKVTSSTTYYNDIPIAGVQVIDSSGVLQHSWIFHSSSGAGAGWTTYTSQIAGTSTIGFPANVSFASTLTYSAISTTYGAGRFALASSTGSSYTGAAGGINTLYETTIATTGQGTAPQVGSNWYLYRETSGSTLWSGSLMRSPEITFSDGETIKIIYALTGPTSPQMNPDDSIYVGIA